MEPLEPPQEVLRTISLNGKVIRTLEFKYKTKLSPEILLNKLKNYLTKMKTNTKIIVGKELLRYKKFDQKHHNINGLFIATIGVILAIVALYMMIDNKQEIETTIKKAQANIISIKEVRLEEPKQQIKVVKEEVIEEPKIEKAQVIQPQSKIEKIIYDSAIRHGVNPQFAIEMARRESSMNQYAIGDMNLGLSDGSYGLFQINLHFHPDVTKEQAFDPYFASEWTMQRLQHDGGYVAWTTGRAMVAEGWSVK